MCTTAKREIRFRESGLVAGVICRAIREALQRAVSPAVNMDNQMPIASIMQGAEVFYQPQQIEQGSFTDFSLQPAINKKFIPEIQPELDVARSDSFPGPPVSPFEQDPRHSPMQAEFLEFKFIGFLNETYILASSDSGLVIIDQHAAHERILFEEIMENRNRQVMTVQKLLIPITLEFPPAELRFLQKSFAAFNKLGFEIESFGRNTVIIHSVPASLKNEDISRLFSNIIDDLFAETNVGKRKIDSAAVARAACTKAVKAHDRISQPEAEALMRRMGECQLPYSCPHGRPTIICISENELEKRFGRK